MKNHISTPWFFLLAIAASVSATLSFQQNTHALVKPTLSASVDSANIQVNGTDVIESASGTTDTPVNVSVKTNNRSGYTVTVSSTSEETALTDANPLNDTKISSITSNYTLADLPVNQWGLRLDSEALYSPIQPRGHAKIIATTTTKNDTEETNTFHVGMKLNSSLRTGNYQNKLLVSITTNPVDSYTELNSALTVKRAFEGLMGRDGDAGNIKHIKYSKHPPEKNITTASIHYDDVSEVPILAWYDDHDKTIYYYSEAEKIYLPQYSDMMFDGYTYLEDIDLSPIDSSNVKSFSQMFHLAVSLKRLDLSKFNTSNATNMNYMFSNCQSLTELDLSNFDTSNVIRMVLMFAGDRALTKLNVSSFNTEKVADMQYMFVGTSNLEELDLSSFKTPKVKMFMNMFDNDNISPNKLKTIYVSEDFDMSSMDRQMGGTNVFDGRTGLCGGNGTCYSSSHSNYEYMRIDRPGAPGYFTYKARP